LSAASALRFARLLLEPVIGVEGMLLALEFFLLGELAAAPMHAILRLEWMASGPVGFAARRRGVPWPRARPAIRDEAFEIAFLVGAEIAGHQAASRVPKARPNARSSRNAATGRPRADQVEIPEASAVSPNSTAPSDGRRK
jgi:hypothetical protein